MTPPKRPGTHRDYRSTPSRGVPVEIDKESTPPPQPMPEIAISRTPSPDETKLALDAHKAQIDRLTGALGEVWEARHLTKRVESIELELKDNTRSTIRMEAVLGELVVPQVKEQMVKINECLHHLAAGSHVSTSIQALGEKLDDLNTSLAGIKTEQATAAERFEAHDLRDREIEKVVHSIEGRVGALEQHNDVEDATAKVRRQIVSKSGKWRSRLIKALAGLAIAGAGWLTHYIAGG